MAGFSGLESVPHGNAESLSTSHTSTISAFLENATFSFKKSDFPLQLGQVGRQAGVRSGEFAISNNIIERILLGTGMPLLSSLSLEACGNEGTT